MPDFEFKVPVLVLPKIYGAEFVTAVGTRHPHEQLEWQRRKQRVLNRSRLAPWLGAISSYERGAGAGLRPRQPYRDQHSLLFLATR
jgi:hypothetical protein